jgi:hypothetical protein
MPGSSSSPSEEAATSSLEPDSNGKTTSAPQLVAGSEPVPGLSLGNSLYARRSHKKSRTGCRTCKTRKIKVPIFSLGDMAAEL